MICNHLKELFQFCKDHEVRLSSSDLVRVVCKQCGIQEVCPSALVEELDVKLQHDEASSVEDNPRSSCETSPDRIV